MKTKEELEAATAQTLAYYNGRAETFKEGTWTHDVTQNYEALLSALQTSAPYKILDFGCGPGRDLLFFRSKGHTVTGLDGAEAFVRMARAVSGCEVLHQNFLHLSLPEAHFDGIFANASLFHVPSQELSQVLSKLLRALVPGGVLFCSNPRGLDSEGMNGERYGAYHTYETWSEHVLGAGFEAVTHYYRPQGLPREEQPWLATVWRRPVG